MLALRESKQKIDTYLMRCVRLNKPNHYTIIPNDVSNIKSVGGNKIFIKKSLEVGYNHSSLIISKILSLGDEAYWGYRKRYGCNDLTTYVMWDYFIKSLVHNRKEEIINNFKEKIDYISLPSMKLIDVDDAELDIYVFSSTNTSSSVYIEIKGYGKYFY